MLPTTTSNKSPLPSQAFQIYPTSKIKDRTSTQRANCSSL